MKSNTHDTRSRNRRHKSTRPTFFPAPVSGTCVMPICDQIRFVWYQIPAPIRTLFYSKPESGVHVTEMIIYDLFLFNLPLATIPAT